MSILHGPQADDDEAAGPRLVAAGDLVVVYERHDKMTALVVTADGSFDNKFGNFRMNVRSTVACDISLALRYAMECTTHDTAFAA